MKIVRVRIRVLDRIRVWNRVKVRVRVRVGVGIRVRVKIGVILTLSIILNIIFYKQYPGDNLTHRLCEMRNNCIEFQIIC